MLSPATLQWRDQLVFTREIEIAGERTEFFLRARAGEFARVRRGVYMRTDGWSALTAAERYRMLVLATSAYSRHPLVLSHKSAASLWRLPWVGPFGRDVHAAGESLSGSSTSLVHRHPPVAGDEPVQIDGVSVGSLARTVIEVAQTQSFELGVVVADAALRQKDHPKLGVPHVLLDKAQLTAQLEKVALRHGSARVRRVIDFADPRADRPGESISRVNIQLARLTSPELQVELRGGSGRRWFVDFWWPEFNLVGEFDGEGKYSDPEFLRGRTPHQALIDEKYREDDLRAAGHGMTRWPWKVATDRQKLRAQLIRAGVR